MERFLFFLAGGLAMALAVAAWASVGGSDGSAAGWLAFLSGPGPALAVIALGVVAGYWRIISGQQQLYVVVRDGDEKTRTEARRESEKTREENRAANAETREVSRAENAETRRIMEIRMGNFEQLLISHHWNTPPPPSAGGGVAGSESGKADSGSESGGSGDGVGKGGGGV